MAWRREIGQGSISVTGTDTYVDAAAEKRVLSEEHFNALA